MNSFFIALWAAIVFGPFLAWLLFRGPGYKRQPLDRPPTGPGWRPTAERFLDPSSNEPIEVWFHERTGERAYVRTHPTRP